MSSIATSQEIQGGTGGTRYQDDNQVRYEVLGTLRAGLYRRIRCLSIVQVCE
jgi:hypothetical protein